ncbi:hypothetical protein F2P45_17795 [Massilia sp. CCM 8733]|uniref:Uncharacterized protein n=1 Tax=Massilia mucilaginosa TaxID=2609282 RepID=A0ABX0NVI0_9BURK|nr:hypothetical protein [Massilia mucilaginosa]
MQNLDFSGFGQLAEMIGKIVSPPYGRVRFFPYENRHAGAHTDCASCQTALFHSHHSPDLVVARKQHE